MVQKIIVYKFPLKESTWECLAKALDSCLTDFEIEDFTVPEI